MELADCGRVNKILGNRRIINALIMSFLLHVLVFVTIASSRGGASGPFLISGMLLVQLITTEAKGADTRLTDEKTEFPKHTKDNQDKKPQTPPALTRERETGKNPVHSIKKDNSDRRSASETKGVNPDMADSSISSPPTVDGNNSAFPDYNNETPDSNTGPAAKLVSARCLDCPYPAYPEMARMRDIEGVVGLKFQVLQDGNVGDIFISESSGFPVLDEAALTKVKQWKYHPATQNNRPKTSYVTRTIRFSIEAP